VIGIRLISDPIKSLGFASIGVGYMGIGTEFDESARAIVVNNLTDAPLFLSWNGVDDHITLPLRGNLLLTISINKEDESESFSLPANSRLYVKQLGVPTSGSVYVTQFRGINDA